MTPIAKPTGAPFIELLSVESTNNYAMGLVHDRVAQHGTAVFAHHQTRGKGQRQKEWLSEPNQNIAISVIIETNRLAPSQQPLLNMAVAVAVHGFFSGYAGEQTAIKWPNDIYWCDRKAGGILIESVLQSHQWPWAVVGVGININQTQFGALAGKPVSLKQITGKEWEPVNLSKELTHSVLAVAAQLPEAAAAVQAQYNLHLYKRGKTVQLKHGSRNFAAIIQSVAPNGELIVQSAVEERFGAGEIIWLG